jgi:hypothetical protein
MSLHKRNVLLITSKHLKSVSNLTKFEESIFPCRLYTLVGVRAESNFGKDSRDVCKTRQTNRFEVFSQVIREYKDKSYKFFHIAALLAKKGLLQKMAILLYINKLYRKN